MTIVGRLVKQFLVLVVLILIFGGASLGVYRYYNAPTPTPTPDPRANLNPIEIISSSIFRIDVGDYDTIVKFRNPNTEYGTQNLRYDLILRDAFGKEVERVNKSTYILPGEVKSVVETEQKFEASALTMEVMLMSADWIELSSLAAQGVPVPVLDIDFVLRDESHIFGTARGKVLNNSDFDLNQVDVAIFLFDRDGNINAVNETEIRTFLSGTTRGFEVSWFSPFEGGVTVVEAEAHTDIFDNDNFLRAYGGNEQFQQIFN